MNIACLQFDPKLGDPLANRSRADALLSALEQGDVDLLVLPEMAFSGYCFKNRDEIAPFAESAQHGITAAWCRATARRLQCFVACGFPERGEIDFLYNSMILVDPTGATVHVHRKHLLYVTDESWATEGDGFACLEVPGLGRCSFAICMDLNPKQFKAPFERYEFASSLFDPPLKYLEAYHSQSHRLTANLAIVCNNWLRSEADKDLSDEQRTTQLLNYWAVRMKPVLGMPIVMAIANRVGVERGIRFAGASCVIDLKHRQILANLNAVEENVLLVHDVPEYR